jgi:regulator of sigma E protease
MNFIFFFISILSISFIIFIHELGHFVVAKIFGVKIEKFSIGFGKELCGWTKNGTRYCLSLFPFGGFVKMLGENIFDEESKNFLETDKKGNFFFLDSWKKFLIVFAGPFMNIFFALFLFLGITAFHGVNYYDLNNLIVGQVLENSKAEIAGIKKNDKILKFNNEKIINWDEFTKKITDFKNLTSDNKIILEIERNLNNEKFIKNFQINFDKTDKDFKIGISPILKNKKVNLLENIKFSIKSLISISSNFYKLFNFSRYFNKNRDKSQDLNLNNMVGPIGIIFEMQKAFQNGFSIFLSIIALISLNLGLINLLPLPILDGGYLIIYLLEFIFRKKINKKILIFLFNFMIIFLFSLMVLVSFKDISRLF